jgi:lipopolysaccharide exporter
VTQDPPAKSLRGQTLSGVKWMSLTRLVAELSALISSILLARLVGPAEFGRTAVAMFLSMLAAAVAQQGVGSFLVSHNAPTRSHLRAASLASLVAGVVGTALMAAFAVTLAPAIFGGRIAYFVALASPVWLLTGLAAVPVAQLQRRLSFGRIGLVQASASVVGAAVAVLLAVYGLQGESLIIGALAGTGASAAVAWAFCRPAQPRWQRREMGEIARYGVPVFGSSVLYAGVRNIDYVLLAAFIGPFQVGLYMRAFVLGSDYQSKISQVLLSVAFPVLSRAKDFEEMRWMRARMIRVHATILLPLLFGLIAVAPEFVPWMYGERWAGAASLTQILAIGGMIAAVGTGTSPLLMATGHPRALFVYSLVAFVAYTIAVLVSIPFGVTAVCVAVVVVRLITFVALQRLIVERWVGIPVLETVRDDVIPAVAGGVPLLVVTMAGLRLCLDAGLPVFLAMALPFAAGLAVYVGILRAFFPAIWLDVRTLTRRLAVPTALRSAMSRIVSRVRPQPAEPASAEQSTADHAATTQQASAARATPEQATSTEEAAADETLPSPHR